MYSSLALKEIFLNSKFLKAELSRIFLCVSWSEESLHVDEILEINYFKDNPFFCFCRLPAELICISDISYNLHHCIYTNISKPQNALRFYQKHRERENLAGEPLNSCYYKMGNKCQEVLQVENNQEDSKVCHNDIIHFTAAETY